MIEIPVRKYGCFHAIADGVSDEYLPLFTADAVDSWRRAIGREGYVEFGEPKAELRENQFPMTYIDEETGTEITEPRRYLFVTGRVVPEGTPVPADVPDIFPITIPDTP